MSALAVMGSVVLFGLTGLVEIGDGWLIWQVVRESTAWFWALIGGLVLVSYGFVPTLQPPCGFKRECLFLQS